MNYIKLHKDKLDIAAIYELVADESCGAVSTFVGITRDNFEDKKVTCLEYEAYDSMALKMMNKICENLRSKWPNLKHIAIYHRLGVVPVKEASVVIAISSPHREASLHSVEKAIDELKKTVPIWKKEKYENGTSEWKENKESSCTINKYTDNSTKQVLLEDIFDKCPLEVYLPVDKSLIQINSSEEELNRRIKCFIRMKRDELNSNNIIDFTTPQSFKQNQEGGETCSRVSSIVPQRYSTVRVQNNIGPQTGFDYTKVLNKLTHHQNFGLKLSPNGQNQQFLSGISGRLEQVEQFLNVPSVPKDVYQRLKIIEDKIRFLETVSPEYRHFYNLKQATEIEKTPDISKTTYTIHDLDNIISNFKKKQSNAETINT